MPADGAVLLTGGTGFVGGELLVRLLERTPREVVLAVRGDAEARRAEVLDRLALGRHAARVRALPMGTHPGADVTTVVHSAASVRFDLPLEEARAVNVGMTRELLGLAAGLPQLERFVHVSTAYVAGEHRNTYERSKAEAEALVRASGLPWQVVRPSIVVGDSRTGWTSSFNVIYAPLRAFARGLLRSVPGDPAAPVDVVPVDFVADALLALLDEATGATHEVVAGPHATTVGELAADAARAMGRPVPPPGDSLDLGELAPYFAVGERFDDPVTRALLRGHGLEAPRLREYLPALIAFAEQARWGRTPVARPVAA